MIVAFGDLELDLLQVELRRSGLRVPVEPQVFKVLAYLLTNRDRVVPKEELMDNIWGGRFVSEAAVTSRIKQARQAIGDSGQAQRLIRTVHGRGYRFVGTAREVGPALTPRYEPVQYAISDGLQIAYQVTGRGDRDIGHPVDRPRAHCHELLDRRPRGAGLGTRADARHAPPGRSG